MPYNIKEQPTLTFVARQEGEAWNRPFVAIYEPSSAMEPGLIESVTFPEVTSNVEGSHVGICVKQKNGRTDYILSSDTAAHVCSMGQMKTVATYALWGKQGETDHIFFMGNGTYAETPRLTIKADKNINVLLENLDGEWYYTASGPCRISLDGKQYVISRAVEVKTLLH